MALILCPDCHREHSDAAPACPGCGRPSAASMVPVSRAFPESNLAGHVLAGKYQLECLIGRGGMASVYRALRLDLQRPVAVKIISPHVAEEQDFAERFLREARIQFLLQHPGVVRVFDLIREQGWLGLAMDWIDGDNLLQFLRKRNAPLAPRQIVDLMIPILDALAYAHQQQVIHRDIKPGNILLQFQGQAIQPKLTDFGIAKMVGDEHQTLSHISLGTPTYMSPEQIEGARDIDHRTDIYSMGVLLYRMAAGKPPFKGPTAMATSMAHLRDAVPSVKEKFENADPRFDAIIQTAMAKSPGERFPDCAAFALALKMATNDERPLPASLQKAMSSRETAVDVDMGWMSTFAMAQQGARADGLLSKQPPTGEQIVASMSHAAPGLGFEDELGKTEISGSQARPALAHMGMPDLTHHTGSHPTHIIAEDAQGSTGELIRKANTGELPSLTANRLPLAWIAVVALCLVLGGLWLLRGDPPKHTPAKEPKIVLSLNSSPAGAAVLHNGNFLGKTPLTLRSSNKPMSLQLKLDGHANGQFHWDAKSSQQRSIVLLPVVKLKINSKPVGARVIVDGTLMGVTPLTVQRLKSQRCQIRLEKEKFVSKKWTWSAAKNETQLFHLAPKLW